MPTLNTGRRCLTHCNPNPIPYEVEVFPLSTSSNLTPKRLGAEGWTLNSSGRTEGSNSHPTSANERDRAEAKRCAQKTTPWLRQWRRAGCLRVSKITGLSASNDLKATSFTFHRRMGDFPRRFVRRR